MARAPATATEGAHVAAGHGEPAPLLDQAPHVTWAPLPAPSRPTGRSELPRLTCRSRPTAAQTSPRPRWFSQRWSWNSAAGQRPPRHKPPLFPPSRSLHAGGATASSGRRSQEAARKHSCCDEVSAAGHLHSCRDELGAAGRLYFLRGPFRRAGRPFGSAPAAPV